MSWVDILNIDREIKKLYYHGTYNWLLPDKIVVDECPRSGKSNHATQFGIPLDWLSVGFIAGVSFVTVLC